MPLYAPITDDPIEAHRIDDRTNLDWLASWCGGDIKGMKLNPSERCIDWYNPIVDDYFRAEYGDFIVEYAKRDFRAVKASVFLRRYQEVDNA